LRKDDFVSSQDFLVIKYLEEKIAEIKCPEGRFNLVFPFYHECNDRSYGWRW